jgi:hypothetical protein
VVLIVLRVRHGLADDVGAGRTIDSGDLCRLPVGSISSESTSPPAQRAN